MKKEFPLEYDLESGTHVIVNRAEGRRYEFTLRPESGAEQRFSYNGDVEFTQEMEDKLDFDQLNALRRFWLEQEKEELS